MARERARAAILGALSVGSLLCCVFFGGLFFGFGAFLRPRVSVFKLRPSARPGCFRFSGTPLQALASGVRGDRGVATRRVVSSTVWVEVFQVWGGNVQHQFDVILGQFGVHFLLFGVILGVEWHCNGTKLKAPSKVDFRRVIPRNCQPFWGACTVEVLN